MVLGGRGQGFRLDQVQVTQRLHLLLWLRVSEKIL